MLLKFVKESGRVLLTLGNTAFFGLLAGVGYLARNGFNCATDHINPGVSIDFSKINYTQALEYFINRNGTLNIPISIHPSIDAISCEAPIIAGAAIGVGVGGLFLVSHYTQKHRKQVAKQQQESLLQDYQSRLTRGGFYQV